MRAEQKGVFRLFTKKYKIAAPDGISNKFDAYVLFEAD